MKRTISRDRYACLHTRQLVLINVLLLYVRPAKINVEPCSPFLLHFAQPAKVTSFSNKITFSIVIHTRRLVHVLRMDTHVHGRKWTQIITVNEKWGCSGSVRESYYERKEDVEVKKLFW